MYMKTESETKVEHIQRDVMDKTQQSNPFTPNICSYFNEYEYGKIKKKNKTHNVVIFIESF